MGLSMALAGGISAFSILFLLFTIFPMTSEKIVEQGITTSEILAVNNSILKTEMDFRTLSTSSGSDTGNFFLTNDGIKKLWNYDNFDLIVTYDADIGGTKTRITESLSYNATAGGTLLLDQPDFKVQRGTTVLTTAQTSTTIIEGTHFDQCTGDCFIMFTDTRYWHGDTDGGNGEPEGTAVYVADVTGLTTELGTVTFTRDSTLGDGGSATDARVVWQIIEYVGNTGGPNEMQVLDQSSCATSGTTTTCTGSVASTSNNADVVVVITGVMNPNGSRVNSYENCAFTSAFNGSDQPVFTRGSSIGEICTIGYAVVEFSGSNWTVQRIPHVGDSGALDTEPMADVGDVSRAFIMQAQYRNTDGTSYDGLCQQGEETWISDTNEISYNHPWQSTNWGSNMNDVTWVVSNSETTVDQLMIVQREQPTDQRNTSGSEEETWSRTIPSPLTYTDSEVAITGLSTHVDGCGEAFPRGSVGAMWDEANDEIDFWQSDAGQEQDYTYEIVEFPNAARTSIGLDDSEWTIVNILPDVLDPIIINTGEIAEIWFKLQYPVFANGFVEVRISTDKGVIAGENTDWYDQAWIYRKQLTINSSQVSADLTDFPVLISITDPDLRERAQAGGDDILFTSADRITKLDHEIEKFDVSTGELVAWVRIPSLSSSVDTEIFMYYGSNSVGYQENVIGVWETNYLGIWHFPSEDFLGVVTQSAMDGSDGGWAVYYGTPPIVGNIMNLAIDEDQLANDERAHTAEQVAYWAFNIENEFDILDTNNNIIGEVGIKRNVDDNWNLVNLRNYYVDPVVVTTYNIDSSAEPPAVVRVRNADKSSFEVKLQNPGDLTTPTAGNVYYTVMEKGAYTLPSGISVESGIVSVTGTNENSNWANTEMVQLTPINSYTNPVVLGQVVTVNDPDWSVFWSSNGAQATPPDSSNIYVGKHVGEDGDTSRNAEDVGYIIIEQSQGTTNGVDWDAALGGDTVEGVGSASPSYIYTLSFTVESFLDSTQNNNDGTNFGSTNSEGAIGNAKEFDGTSDYVALNMFFSGVTSIPQMTASAWVRVNSGEGDWSILDFDDSEYFTFTISGASTTPDTVGYHTNSATGGGSNVMSSVGLVADRTWHHVQVVYDGTDKIIYVDGVEDNRVLNPYGSNDIGSATTRYGFIGDGSEALVFNGGRDNIFFDGITDDVRFSLIDRSADWNLAEYNNQFSPDTFYSVGIEEEYGVPIV